LDQYTPPIDRKSNTGTLRRTHVLKRSVVQFPVLDRRSVSSSETEVLCDPLGMSRGALCGEEAVRFAERARMHCLVPEKAREPGAQLVDVRLVHAGLGLFHER
jgi:hypothetical protein